MGVGAGLWEHLSAVKKEERLSFLWDKRLAVDLSYWLVQQQKALKGKAVRKPHLRLTFYRVINLIAKVGARPIFVVDGEPPALKKASQEKRSKRSSYVSANHYSSECENSSQNTFKENVEECVVMLTYLGIPVIRAEGEAESLCAELNRKGLVDACVTSDSDAFVHGAICVIKNIQADPKDPLVELYQAIDIEEKLGLYQTHLLALALLVGCDYSPEGVPGVGFQSALRLVQCFSENDVIDRLRAWGKGELPTKTDIKELCDTDKDNEQIIKYTHCSKCGHLGNKRDHLKFGCQTCAACTNEDTMITGCKQKSNGFSCKCRFCVKPGLVVAARECSLFRCESYEGHAYLQKANQNEKTRSRAWWMKICCKMATTSGFPDENIIDIFLKPDVTIPEDLESLTLIMAQQPPDMEKLESFLGKYLFWDATYIRRKTLPLLSHLCLVELAAMNSGTCTRNRPKGLINDLYRPCSIERVKINYSEPLFVLKWGTVSNGANAEQWLGIESKSSHTPKLKRVLKVPSTEVARKACNNDSDGLSKSGHWGFTTNENTALVRAACPELAEVFDKSQVAKQESLTKKLKRKRVEEGKDDGQQSIFSCFKLEHTPNARSEVVRKPHAFISSMLTLDTPATASWPCDAKDKSQALFSLGADVKYWGSGLSFDTGSPLRGFPEKIVCKKPVSRKLSF